MLFNGASVLVSGALPMMSGVYGLLVASPNAGSAG